MHSHSAQILVTAVTVVAGVGIACMVGCTEPEGSVCVEPAPGWEQRLLDRDDILAEGASLASDGARQMYDAGCLPVARKGVDSRNGETISARPFCDDNCMEDERWAVILYYDGVETAQDCVAVGGCPIMMGAMPGRLAACIPDGAPLWPTAAVCSTP